MFDEEKVLLQLETTVSVIVFLLMINTIALVVTRFFIVLEEFSFYMWAFITFMGWIITVIQFKKADIHVNWKRK